MQQAARLGAYAGALGHRLRAPALGDTALYGPPGAKQRAFGGRRSGMENRADLEIEPDYEPDYEFEIGETSPESGAESNGGGSRFIRIADGPATGKCIGRLVNREFHRLQKSSHWLRRGKHRFLTIDAVTYRAHCAAWSLLVVRCEATATLFVMPASRFRELAFEVRTPSGMQLGVTDGVWMKRPAFREMTLFEFIPASEWGSSRRVRGEPLALDAGHEAPARLLHGELNEPLTAAFEAYHNAHPDLFVEYITCAYFVLEMGWDADAMSELLGLIAVDNNYRSRYRRMLVNLDAEFGPLIRVGGLKTQ